MASALPCRLIVDPPGEGAWNMAVDDALLETAAKEGAATLRFYQWSEPTLSLGYFQRYEDRRLHSASADCECVRRHTGGGAILHDQELTYSLALPASAAELRGSQRYYFAAHETLIDTLRLLTGANLALHTPNDDIPNEELPDESAEKASFLCFERRARGDVTTNDGAWKICGSAQRKRQAALLQHGSVLLRTSLMAPELHGLWEVAGVSLSPTALVDAWLPQLAVAVGLSAERTSLTNSEENLAKEIRQEKFASVRWTRRR